MKQLFLIAGMLLSLQSFGQTSTSRELAETKKIPLIDSIKIKDISLYIGQRVIVQAKIYGGIHLKGNKLTLLNVGAKYPDQPLTLVIKDEDRVKFKKPPEEEFKGQLVSISGVVSEYNGKPQIIVTESKQLLEVLPATIIHQ